MSEGLGDFFKLVAEDKKKKKEEFKEEVKNLGLNSVFGEIAAEKKRIKEEKERELQAKIDEEKRKQEQFNAIVGNIDTNSLFKELAQAKKQHTKEEAEEKARQQKVLLSFENFLTKKIDDIEEIQEEVEEIVEEEEELVEEEIVEEEVVEEPSLIEKSLGMLSEPTEKIGAEENFATLDDLRNHYKDFLGKIQQQLSTLGGGGENNNDGFEYVSDKSHEALAVPLPADTWTKVSNDGASGSTKRQHLPEGVTRIYDVTNDVIKLDQLPNNGWVIFRFGVKVIPNVDNVTLKTRIAWTTGSGFTFYLTSPGALLNDGAGIEYEEQFTLTFYVGDDDTKQGSGILEARADGTCNITDCAFMTIVG